MAAKKTKTFDSPKTLTTTPSGVQIAYFTGQPDAPRRAYFIRKGEPGMADLVWEDETKAFEEGWHEVPSVTTVLDVLGKDALSWWGMRVGLKAVEKLWAEGLMSFTAEEQPRLAVTMDAVWQYADFSDGGNVEQLVKQNDLDVNKVKGEAAERGTSAHAALEAWAVTGEIPNPEDYPPEEFPYLVALAKFIADVGEDAWETGGVEVAVGSAEHGFAGRYDLRGRFLKDVNLVNQTLLADGNGVLKKGPKRIVVPAGTKCLLDAKSAKRIYPTHLMQLEAYEGAGIEDGYDSTDMRAVIHLSPLGEYQFYVAKAEYRDFLDLIPAYHAIERVKKVLSS